MIIYPAMELVKGRSAGHARGGIADIATYLADPVEAVLAWEKAGAEWAHIADLDALEKGGPRQHGLIVDIALSVSLSLQVAGGFRTPEHLQRMFDAGVDRVIIDSLALEQSELTNALIAAYGADHVVLRFDTVMSGGRAYARDRDGKRSSLWKTIGLYPAAKHIILADGSGDTSAHLALVEQAARRLPHVALQSSSRVASLAGLRALKRAGAAGAIVGASLWEQRIGIDEAIQAVRA